MILEITVFAEIDEKSSTSHVYIGFPKEQGKMTTQEAAHLLTAGVALLVKACAKTDTGIKDHELMKEIYQHLEEEFSSITSRDNTYVNEEGFKKTKAKTNKKKK